MDTCKSSPSPSAFFLPLSLAYSHLQLPIPARHIHIRGVHCICERLLHDTTIYTIKYELIRIPPNMKLAYSPSKNSSFADKIISFSKQHLYLKRRRHSLKMMMTRSKQI